MKFMKKKLSNGMTVIMEKRELPVVAFGITNKFGASHEESKVKGICHFIEHLVFTGTKTRTHEDISREIEKKGGILNAFTSNEVTSFWCKLPSEHIFAGMDIFADMLNNPLFEPKKFEKEKKVIVEEIRMYHDDPKRFVYEQLEENLYKKPFGEGIIGSEKTIMGLNRDFVYNYFRENYSPENYIVTIVGNADFEKVCDYLENKFKGAGKKISPLRIQKKNGQSIEKRAGLDQAHFIFGVHAPMPGTKAAYALEVLDGYLGNGMSSRLFLKIREEKGLAYAVRSMITAEKNYAYYSIYVGTKKENIEEVKKIIVEEFRNVKKMTAKDLEEAKERLIGLKKVQGEESVNVMNELMYHECVSKAEEFYDYEKKIKSITLEDVKKAAELKDFSTAVIVPK